MSRILVTGGAGYIGSHTVLELLEMGEDVVVIDNLSNSNRESLVRVEAITGKKLKFIEIDLLDRPALAAVFASNAVDAVIHFAGLKAVGESMDIPLRYYQNNLTGTLNLLEEMNIHSVKNLVFSSSATVYGDPASVPITEDFPVSATNPYGRSKLIIEEILGDLYISDPAWNIVRLRYFNPVGAHKSGLIGEDPSGIPNNIMPYISQVAVGKLEKLSIFGNDYDTPDGTGVRDYIHVVDLAQGHLKALAYLQTRPGLETINLGTGSGYSVLELIEAFEAASEKNVAYQFVQRRPGDIAQCYADTHKAAHVLSWKADRGLNEMCEDAWRWQSKNPNGFSD
ncbi:MAG: UDP-glucose 4-epimerase GalE [Candidatus Marinimicrobia bacterium]|nr:UDP-glucose 4-epimerase GalE [Candidatus Neomarinimicrobiota bacterium]